MEAHKIFQSFPDRRDAMRACMNIEMLVSALKNPSACGVPATELAIKNRLAASVVMMHAFELHSNGICTS